MVNWILNTPMITFIALMPLELFLNKAISFSYTVNLNFEHVFHH